MRGERYLTKTSQYSLVYRRGGSWRSGLVVMRALPNGLDLSRYGFSVSRRVGKAVIRNRTKRLFREVARQTPVQPGWDIVFIARPPAGKARFSAIEQTIKALLFRAGLLSGEHEEVGSGTN